LPHFELAGKTLLLIGGSGAIGSRVAALSSALGMICELWGRTSAEPLESALSRADFVSLHCPLTASTRYLLGAVQLAAMKPTAYLINTARGAVVHEAALVAALRTGTLAGAALDVQELEPPEAGSALYGLNNVILTPHIGWKRRETRQRLIDRVADTIAGWARGEPQNVVVPA
jgi:glycerate dehydrogenase